MVLVEVGANLLTLAGFHRPRLYLSSAYPAQSGGVKSSRVLLDNMYCVARQGHRCFLNNAVSQLVCSANVPTIFYTCHRVSFLFSFVCSLVCLAAFLFAWLYTYISGRNLFQTKSCQAIKTSSKKMS